MNSTVQHSVCEKYGSGIGRIINYFKETQLPLPSFENHSGGFLVTVYASFQNDSSEKVVENLTENQVRILRLIEKNKFITAKEIGKTIKISQRKVQSNMLKLKSIGIIRRIGPSKGGYWEIRKENE